MANNKLKLRDLLQSTLDKIYTATHYSLPDNDRALSTVKARINKSIEDIGLNNMNNIGEPNITRIFNRIYQDQNDKDVIKDVEDLFSDKKLIGGVMSMYLENKWISDIDTQIDVILKYMPKLIEALDVRKENVLASDHFTKDFINVLNLSSGLDRDRSSNVLYLKEAYNLGELIETTYDEAARYGEVFLYTVPYAKAFKKLNDEKNTNFNNLNIKMENGIIIESDIGNHINIEKFTNSNSDMRFFINVEICKSNIPESIVREAYNLREIRSTISESSMNYDLLRSINEASGERKIKSSLDKIDDKPPKEKKEKTKKFDKTIGDDFNYEDIDSLPSDGLITNDKYKEKKSNDEKITVNGCIIKKLPRRNVIPICIEDICLMYYYVEVLDETTLDKYRKDSIGINGITNLGNTYGVTKIKNKDEQDKILKYISKELSKYIDSKFINANQDLRKELYAILKANDLLNNPNSRLRVTCIPAEDMVHFYFRKDPVTHHGISDLQEALVPATLYVGLYLSNIIGILTRSNDKRIYYVQQNVDTNISKVMLNTLTQIKKGNFGVRQMEDINNVLGIVGRYSDLIVPLNANGDAPVRPEVLSGQNIDTHTELMDMLEEMAVNVTDVPIELIQARRSMEYATEYTMSNSKFFKKVIARQAIVQKHLSRLLTIVYNCEFGTNEVLNVMLPPPMFLSIVNTNQIITNVMDMANSISNICADSDMDDNAINILIKNIQKYYLGTYINWTAMDILKEQAKMKSAIEQNQSEEG